MGEIEVMHIVGLDVTIGPVRRQRCAWCGALLAEDDFSRMAWPLNGDGTDPGPPPPWQVGAIVAVLGGRGEGFTGMRVIPEDDWPVSDDGDYKRIPDGCCGLLDVEVTR